MYITHVYNLCFMLEWSLHIAAFGLVGFFCGSGSTSWAILDTVVVIFAAVETLSYVLLLETGNQSFSNIRFLRMIRTAKVLRAFRALKLVRFLVTLQTLLFSILVTLKALVWAAFLMVITIWVFAVALTECSMESEGWETDGPVRYHWGSLAGSMATLFQTIANGISWRDASEIMFEQSIVGGWMYYFYIVFTYFVMLNLVTGVFCNSAIEAAKKNPAIAAYHLMQTRKAYLDNCRKLFSVIRHEESDRITLEDLEELFTNDMAHAHFQALGVDFIDAGTLFGLLDADDDGSISIEEFAEGCEALRGGARGVDVATLLRETRMNSDVFFNELQQIKRAVGIVGYEDPEPPSLGRVRSAMLDIDLAS